MNDNDRPDFKIRDTLTHSTIKTVKLEPDQKTMALTDMQQDAVIFACAHNVRVCFVWKDKKYTITPMACYNAFKEENNAESLYDARDRLTNSGDYCE